MWYYAHPGPERRLLRRRVRRLARGRDRSAARPRDPLPLLLLLLLGLPHDLLHLLLRVLVLLLVVVAHLPGPETRRTGLLNDRHAHANSPYKADLLWQPP